MKIHHFGYFALGVVATSLVYSIVLKRDDISLAVLKSITIRKTAGGRGLSFHLGDDPSYGKRIYPAPHAGGAQQTTQYKWAAEHIRSTGCSKPEAFQAMANEFPGCVSDEKLMRTAQYNAFRSGVDRALKKLPLETPMH